MNKLNKYFPGLKLRIGTGKKKNHNPEWRGREMHISACYGEKKNKIK